VTVITGVTAREVSGMLADRRHAIMASAASANDLRVIDSKCRRPHIAGVTVFADVARLHMRRAFAGGLRAVMAAETVA